LKNNFFKNKDSPQFIDGNKKNNSLIVAYSVSSKIWAKIGKR